MEKITYFVFLLIFVIIGREVFTLYWINITIKKIRNLRQTVSANPKNKIKFILLIPVYEEQAIIASSVDFFLNILSFFDGMRIYFITSSREGKEKGTTYDVLTQILQVKGHHKIGIIHSPNKNGRKATQLNYAINTLNKIHDDKIYAIFDVDSKPDKRGFEYVKSMEQFLHNGIYQMFPVYTSNFYSNRGILTEHFLRASALFQTRRTLYYEILNCLNQLEFQSSRRYFWQDPHYCIGHGLFVSSKITKKIPFPENTIIEDLAFGYRLLFSGRKVIPVPYFDNCAVPNSIQVLFKQSSVWYAAEQEILNYFRYCSKSNFILIPKWIAKMFVLKKYLKNMDWFIWPFLCITVFALNIVQQSYIGIILFSTWLLIIFIQAFRMINFLIEEKYLNNILMEHFSSILFLPLRFVLNGIGPLSHYFRVARSIVLKTDSYYKTER